MFWYITLAVVVVLLYFFGHDLKRRWFAAYMNWFTNSMGGKYTELKKDLFKELHSQVSHDPELRKKNEIRILEIGVGTGANFEHYPDGTNLVVIDPNPHFHKYYNDNRSKFTKIKSEEIIVSTGEEMDMVESNSIDVVVITLVMCSMLDITRVLKQIRRVLAPGGKFFFLEHIKEFSEDHSTRLRCQKILTASGLWPFLFDGCYLDRDMLEDIKSAGFSDVDAKRVHLQMKNFALSIVSPHLIGVATK